MFKFMAPDDNKIGYFLMSLNNEHHLLQADGRLEKHLDTLRPEY